MVSFAVNSVLLTATMLLTVMPVPNVTVLGVNAVPQAVATLSQKCVNKPVMVMFFRGALRPCCRVHLRQRRSTAENLEAAKNGGNFAARGQSDVVLTQRRGARDSDVDVGVGRVNRGDSGNLYASTEQAAVIGLPFWQTTATLSQK